MNTPRNKKLFLLVGCCLLAVIVLISIQGTLAASKRSPRSERFQSEIATLESSLKNAQSESEAEAIREQLELFYQMSTLVTTLQPAFLSEYILIATRQAHVTLRHETMVVYATLSFQRIPTGIIEDAVHASFLPKDFLIGNAWFDRTGDRLIQVYAGAVGKDPKQGAVIVSVALDHSIGMFLTPTKHGLVRVVDAKGYTLILKSEDGTIFYFNVLGRKFTSTVDEIVPTITPEVLQPSATPTPVPVENNAYP